MEGFGAFDNFATYAAPALLEEFVLLDLGCSAGIDPNWRCLGDKLRAFGFDPDIAEIERLRSVETSEKVTYWPRLVAARSPWQRLSVAETMRLRQRRAASGPPSAIRLSEDEIDIPSFLECRDIESVDFIKIDVDGRDYEILESLGHTLRRARVLGLGLEVNFFGGGYFSDHTFHNTDRFMRQHDFDLFNVTTRSYANSALPARYINRDPAQTVFGRPIQGDAIYLLDICAEYYRPFRGGLSSSKKLKLATMFSLFSLPDCAAEILLQFGGELAHLIDVEAGLDLLARQAQEITGIRGPGGRLLTYREFIERFRADGPEFYP
jgi:hypothetical protein